MNTIRTLLMAVFVACAVAAHADITIMRQEIISNSIFGGDAKMTCTISIKGNKVRMEERETYTKDGKERVGGGDTIINDGDSGRSYFFNPFRHTYIVSAYHPGIIVTPGISMAAPAIVTPLAGTKTFLGHVCHGYHIVKSNPATYYTTLTADVYVATDMQPVDAFSQYRGPIWEAADAFQQIGGTPLHMDMQATGRDGRQETFTVDVNSISTKPVRDNMFSVLKDYKLVPSPPPPAIYHPTDRQSVKPQ